MTSGENTEVDSLLSFNLKNCNKSDLLKKASKLQELLKDSTESIDRRLDSSSSANITDSTLNEILKRLDKVEKDNVQLKKEVRELSGYADECDEKIYNLEKQVNQLDQYIRRENITLSGIPEELTDDKLEEKVVEVLAAIDVKVNDKDIVACHRLAKTKKERNKKEPSKVIVRFTNRKNAISSLKNKKRLRDNTNPAIPKNVYINDQLCPAYQRIFDECLKYKYNKKITSCWSFNGTINIKLTTDTNERPQKIFSMDDLHDAVEENRS